MEGALAAEARALLAVAKAWLAELVEEGVDAFPRVAPPASAARPAPEAGSAPQLELAVAPGPCLGMMSIEKVTKARAKELGIELRAKPNGPKEIWLELELKPEGELKAFMHVSLEVRDGDKFLLGWTPLKEERLGTGNLIVHALVNREFAEKITLTVVVGATGEEGHELRVTDFVDPKKID